MDPRKTGPDAGHKPNKKNADRSAMLARGAGYFHNVGGGRKKKQIACSDSDGDNEEDVACSCGRRLRTDHKKNGT